MDLGLQGKTAVVLGAGGGLGRAIAKSLAGEGARVAGGDINAESLEPTLQDIAAAGSEGLPLTWDLADLSLIDGHVASIERRFGTIDVLINNTGGPPPTPAFGDFSEECEATATHKGMPVLRLSTRAAWERWLAEHGATSSGVWLTFAKKGRVRRP